jgi:hypothetical protein
MTAVGGFRRDIVILSCAVSAGIHGALTPDHFAEGTAPGVGFLAATVLLAGLVLAITLGPPNEILLGGAMAVLGGLIASYGFAITTGIPVLHPAVEHVNGLALATKGFEAVGLLAASMLLHPRSILSQPQGALT